MQHQNLLILTHVDAVEYKTHWQSSMAANPKSVLRLQHVSCIVDALDSPTALQRVQ